MVLYSLQLQQYSFLGTILSIIIIIIIIITVIIIIIIIIIIIALVSSIFFPLAIIPFNQCFKLTVCSTFIFTRDVSSTAFLFCKESIEWLPGIISRHLYTQLFSNNSSGPSDCCYNKAFHIPHSLNLYAKIFLYLSFF